MRDLDLTSLRLFVAVCDTRNIARAAADASLVGSAVSKRLAQLEAQLGTPLLVRQRHGVEPTAAGESLREHARELLLGAQRIERDMAAYAAGVRGQVRVLATASVMAERLADDVADFLTAPEHAGIRVELEVRASPQVVQGIRDGVASLGICWQSQHGADLRGLGTAPYRQDRLGLVMHAGHPLASAHRLRLADALDWDYVGLPVNSAVQALLVRAAAEIGRHLKYRMIVTDFEAALRVVRTRLAISVIPMEVALPRAAQYGLRVVPLDEPWAERAFALCFRGAGALTPAAQLLLDHLQRCGADGPWHPADGQAPNRP
jgi:DNA-binding transcriptional LysR family regulator